MKKLLVLSLLLSLVGIAWGQTSNQIDLSATLIAKLSQKGILQVSYNDNTSVFAKVEPQYWQTLTHLRKEKTVQAIMNIAKVNKKGQLFVIIMDMTSGGVLAKGFIEQGLIKIYK